MGILNELNGINALAEQAFIAVTGERPTEVYYEEDIRSPAIRVKVDGIVLYIPSSVLIEFNANKIANLMKIGIQDWFEDEKNESLIKNGE